MFHRQNIFFMKRNEISKTHKEKKKKKKKEAQRKVVENYEICQSILFTVR